MSDGLDRETRAICDRIMAICLEPRRLPNPVRAGPPMTAERWARIHRHRFAEWRPGSHCRNCGREAGHAVHV